MESTLVVSEVLLLEEVAGLDCEGEVDVACDGLEGVSSRLDWP